MALSISCGNPPPISIPTPYSSTLVASGGTPAYTYSITAGVLPPGLTLAPSTGVISGTPTTAGTWIVTAKVTDSTTATATVQCSFVANQASWLWQADFFSTTDGWMALPTDGIEIQYNIWRYWPIADPSADYQVGEVLLEMVNPDDGVTANVFYNYVTTPSETVSIPSGALAERGRYFAVLNNNLTSGVVQYSLGLQLTGASGGLGVTSFFFFQWRDFPWAPGQEDNQPVEYGWLEFNVNTNSVNVPLVFQVDGVTAYGPFNVSGSFYDRASTMTLPAAIIGRQWRIVPEGGVGGTSTTIQLEKLVPHTYPWTVTPDGMPREFSWIEMEINTGGVSIPMQFQVMGVSGVSSYNFNASGIYDNRFFTITLPQNLTGTQWRVIPTVAGYQGIIQIFKADARDYPWSNADYGCPKTFGWLEIQCNTNGHSVPMQFQLDGGAQTYNFSISGTYFSRTNIITLPSNLSGTLWRVTPTTAGYTGLIQIFSVTPKFEKLPCPITHWDSLGQVYGSAGWKILFQCWFDYSSTTPLLVSIYRDADVLFYQTTIPAHPARDIARFYLPPVNTPQGASPAFNKSQAWWLSLDSVDVPCTSGGQSSTAPGSIACSIKICPIGVSPFTFYRDGSRLEVHNLSADQRGSFDQKIIWTLEPLQGV